jgi:hypothetical protein
VKRGAAVAAVYLAVAAATFAIAGRRLLPLFEGFRPPEPYSWVQPPRPYAPANEMPTPVSVTQNTAAALGLTTPDGQCTVSLAAGSLAATGNARVQARLTPIAASQLGALPRGLHADGNAYRVELTAQPSGQSVEELEAPGHLVLKGAIPIESVLYSADGRSWTTVTSQRVGDPTMAGALFSRTGVYLAASSLDPASVAAVPTGGAGTAAVALAVVGLAVVMLLGPGGIRRLVHKS